VTSGTNSKSWNASAKSRRYATIPSSPLSLAIGGIKVDDILSEELA
jgi:hypothetical protein